MNKFIKIDFDKKMEKDYNECFKIMPDDRGKDCSTCSCNYGANIGCIRRYGVEKEVDYGDLLKIVDYHGYERQSRQCMEECGELIQALNKLWRKFPQHGDGAITQFDFLDMLCSEEYTNVVEEIADVWVTLKELMQSLRCRDEVIEIAEQKVQRELARIRGEEVKKVVQRELERMRGEEDEDVPFK